MLTGEIRCQIDAVWNAFLTGRFSTPLEAIEQITNDMVAGPSGHRHS